MMLSHVIGDIVLLRTNHELMAHPINEANALLKLVASAADCPEVVALHREGEGLSPLFHDARGYREFPAVLSVVDYPNRDLLVTVEVSENFRAVGSNDNEL